MHETQFDIFTDDLDTVGRELVLAARPEQLIDWQSLNTVTAVLVLMYIDTGVTNHKPINDQSLLEHQSHQSDTDTDFFCGHDASAAVLAKQFSVIKFEFRTTQSPTGVHAGKFDLHTNSCACPAFNLILILGNARQKKSKQTNGNSQQNDDDGRSIAGDFHDAAEEGFHTRTTSN